MSQILRVFLENERAIRSFIARFRPRAQDIDDIAQETFLRGFAAELKGKIREPKAFLFQIAKNIVLADARTARRRPTDFIEDSGGADILIDASQVSTEAWVESRRKLALFARAVAQLTPQCRTAFLLRRIEGLHYKQIANRMNIGVSAVEKHVTNGLMKCNAYLRAHGYDPSEFGVQRAQNPEPVMLSLDERE